MLDRHDSHHRHSQSFRFKSNIHDDFIDSAVREEQKTIRRTEHKVTQNDLTKPFHVFEEHRLALSVRANDEIVKREGQLDDRMEAGETSMTREHLFDKNARVSCGKKMNEPISRDRLGAHLRCLFNPIHLCGFNPVEDLFCLCEVIKRGIWHIEYPYLKNHSIASCGCLQELTRLLCHHIILPIWLSGKFHDRYPDLGLENQVSFSQGDKYAQDRHAGNGLHRSLLYDEPTEFSRERRDQSCLLE